MASYNPIRAARLMALYLDEIEAAGIEVEFCQDIGALQAVQPALEDKPLSPYFHPDAYELVPDNSFWIHGTAKGRTVLVQAARIDDTGHTPLGVLIDARFRRFFRTDEEPVTDCKAMARMQGRCVYHGEGWVAPDFRKTNLARTFIHLGTIAILMRWSPDYIYAFFDEQVVDSGFPSKAWFKMYEAIGRHYHGWLLPTDLIGWMDSRHLVNLVELEYRRSVQGQPPR